MNKYMPVMISVGIAGSAWALKELYAVDYYNIPQFVRKFARSPVHTGKIFRINLKVRRGKIISGKEFKYAFEPYVGQLVMGVQKESYRVGPEDWQTIMRHYSPTDPTYTYNIGGVNIARTVDFSNAADYGRDGIYFYTKMLHRRDCPVMLSVSVYDDSQLKVYTKKDSEQRHIIFGDPEPRTIKADKVFLDYPSRFYR
jgi:hypothetical protein